MSVISCLCAIFLPFLFGFFLLVSRIKLAYVNKKVLNFGNFFINLLSLTFFAIQYALFMTGDNQPLSIIFNFFNYDKTLIDFGINITCENIIFLIFASSVFTLLALYSKFYFDKKKQFIFTKQRFYLFLSFLTFNTYLFFVSPNLIQSLVFWISEGFIIFVFSYFDIFKNPANFNITRFQRISLIGDFAFITGVFILLRYAVLSQGYINSASLDFEELNILISYTYGICSPVEFKLAALCFVTAFLSRLFIFPLSPYCSFFANSSNIFYLSAIVVPNVLLGTFICIKTLPFVDLWDNLALYIIILSIVSVVSSAIFLLFEKNIKIIFGYLISILNSLFLILYLTLRHDLILSVFLAVHFLILFFLMILFAQDKVSLNKRLINKQKGFILEKAHIVFFEVLPEKIASVLNFIDVKIIQNIIPGIVSLLDTIFSLFVLKIKRKDKIKYIRDILIVFALVALLAIFIALFGRYKC